MSIGFLTVDRNLEEFRQHFFKKPNSVFDKLFDKVISHYQKCQKETKDEDTLFAMITILISNDITGHVPSGKEDAISKLYMTQVKANFDRDRKSGETETKVAKDGGIAKPPAQVTSASQEREIKLDKSSSAAPLPEQEKKIEKSVPVKITTTTTTVSPQELIQRGKEKFDQVLAAIHEHENLPKPAPKLQQPPEDYEQIALALMEKMKKEGDKGNRCTALLNALGTDGHNQMISFIGKRNVEKKDGGTELIIPEELKPLRDFFFQDKYWEDHVYEQGHFAFRWQEDFEEIRELWIFVDKVSEEDRVNKRLLDRDYSKLPLIPFFVRYFSDSCNEKNASYGQWGYGAVLPGKYDVKQNNPFNAFKKSHPEFIDRLTELRMEILKYAESNPEAFAEQASKQMMTRRWLLQSEPFREIYWKYLRNCIAKNGQDFLDDPTCISVVKDLLEDPLAKEYLKRRDDYNSSLLGFSPYPPPKYYTANAVVCAEWLLKLIEDSKKFSFDQSATELWSKEDPFKTRLEELKQKKDKIYSQYQFQLNKDKYEKEKTEIQIKLKIKKTPYQECHNKIKKAEQSIQANKILIEESNKDAALLKEYDAKVERLELQIANLEEEISKVDDRTLPAKTLAVFKLKRKGDKTQQEIAELKKLEAELASLSKMDLNAKLQKVGSSAIQTLREQLISERGKREIMMKRQSDVKKLLSQNDELEKEIKRNKESQESIKKDFIHLEQQLVELDRGFSALRQKVENDCADIDREIAAIEKTRQPIFEKFKKEKHDAIQKNRVNNFIMFLNKTRLDELKQKKDKIHLQHRFQLNKDKYEKERVQIPKTEVQKLAELDNAFSVLRQKVENDCAYIDREIEVIEKMM